MARRHPDCIFNNLAALVRGAPGVLQEPIRKIILVITNYNFSVESCCDAQGLILPLNPTK